MGITVIGNDRINVRGRERGIGNPLAGAFPVRACHKTMSLHECLRRQARILQCHVGRETRRERETGRREFPQTYIYDDYIVSSNSIDQARQPIAAFVIPWRHLGWRPISDVRSSIYPSLSDHFCTHVRGGQWCARRQRMRNIRESL